MPSKIKRTRNAEQWTESKYWGVVRSALRRAFRYWKPALNVKLAARRKYTGSNKRQKWEYQCNNCKQWFKEGEVQIDHVIPVGSLRCAKDLVPFLERLTPENEDAFQILCRDKCHLEKTKREKEAKQN